MELNEESDEKTYSDLSFEEGIDEITRKKQVKRMLEDKLERKRLRDEFKDDFDELNGEFDWDEIDK